MRGMAIDPRNIDIKPHPNYHPALPLHWVEGYDIGQETPVLVPARLAGCMLGPKFGPPCSEIDTSNGLASGNTLEEAICHALCELIERDALTMADLNASWRPRWRNRRGAATCAREVRDDTEIYPEIDLSAAPQGIRALHRKFLAAGLNPMVKDITSDLGVASVIAVAAEEVACRPIAHLGLGTHPDAAIAVTRALTELAQSRATDIQGVREDISDPEDSVPDCMRHIQRVRRIDPDSWYHCATSQRRRFEDLPSVRHGDILDDIRFMIRRLRENGMKQVVAVNLTHEDFDIPVVRLMVPGLESWAVLHSRVGMRAARLWRDN